MPSCVVKGNFGSAMVSSGSFVDRKNHEPNFELVLLGEIVVALVVRGHAHDGAGAVIHQDVVGDPDRNAFAVERIDGVAVRVHAVLFDLADVAGFFGLALLGDQLLHRGAERLVVAREVSDQRMLRRKLHRGRAENRIDARGEDADLRSRRPGVALKLEIDQRAFAAADPVALHGAHFLGPALELVEIAQQLFGVLGRAHEPLLQLALLDERVFVAPAASVDDLLVGQHRRALRAPVHLALLAIDQSLLVELEEEPLVPAVVIGQAGGDLARPVVGEAEALHLRLHVGDVAERPLARRRVVGDGGILRGQAERIPSHGMKHVVAVHPHVAGERVADRVVAHVPHVQRARGIGQHLEDVIFLLGRVGLGGVERGILLPALEPLLFDGLRVVALVIRTRSG